MRPLAANPNAARSRTLVALATAFAVCLGGLALASAAPASAALPKTSISVKVSKKSVTSGAKVTVSGVVKKGKKTSKATVRIQSRTSASAKWKTIKTVKANAKGKYSYRFTPKRTLQYRATVVKSKNIAAKASKTAKVAVKPALSFTVSSGVTVAKETKKVSGKATKSYAGKYVAIQYYDDVSWAKGWKDLASARITKAGTYATSVTITHKNTGKVKLRARLAGSGGQSAATTKARSVAIYDWYNLTATAPLAAQYGEALHTGGFSDGVTWHNHSVYMHARDYSWPSTKDYPAVLSIPEYKTYNVKNRCVTLRTALKLHGGGAELKGKVTFDIQTDGKTVHSRAVDQQNTGPFAVNARISGANHLRLGVTLTEYGSQDYVLTAGYQTPQVLCTSSPAT